MTGTRDFKMANAKHVVVDSGAFIRNAAIEVDFFLKEFYEITLKTIGEKLYTLQDVVEEIRDRATRQRLQVLPYELIFREPSAEAIKIVTEFSKKTGDYRSLSAVDIRVMALTYQLAKEFVGEDHIKTEPEKKVQWTATSRPLERATDIAGFYLKPKNSSSRTTSECSSQPDPAELRRDEVPESSSTITVERIQEDTEANTAHVTGLHDDQSDRDRDKHRSDKQETDAQEPSKHSDNTFGKQDLDAENAKQLSQENDSETKEDSVTINSKQIKSIEPSEGEVISEDCIEESDSDDEEEEEDNDDDDDDDDDGWITPSNIKSMKVKMGGEDLQKAEVAVGCITTDFAIQNVLIQMGLNVISIDGFLIKQAKSYVLRCFACMKITTNVQKRFCPHCGNSTLTMVSMTANEDGSVRYFMSRRRPVNKRGTECSLPMPKGGKHAANPRLAADQPSAHNRMSRKAQTKVDVFNPDYVANTSPFAINDVTSNTAQLGITGRKGQTHNWDRRNPNESRRKLGRKK